jgi:hypothetical protein
MGERNTVFQLQNYIVGEAAAGLQLSSDGVLDLEKSFERVNYFLLLQNVTVKNNVQAEVGNRPVDMVATRIPSNLVGQLEAERGLTGDLVWVTSGADKQALPAKILKEA